MLCAWPQSRRIRQSPTPARSRRKLQRRRHSAGRVLGEHIHDAPFAKKLGEAVMVEEPICAG